MALLRSADCVAAVAAGVDQDLRIAVVVTHDDDAVLADERHEEVAGVGYLAVVAHEVPGASKDPLKLELVDVGVLEDAPVDGTGLDVDEVPHLSRVGKIDRHD